MVDYENIVAFDNSFSTNSETLSINIQGEFLRNVTTKMGTDSMHVLTVYVLLFKTDVTKIMFNGKYNGNIVPLSKREGDIIYYGVEDLTGFGNPLYVDSYLENSGEYIYRKNIQRSIKVEIKTFKRSDGYNWTTVYTTPIFKKKIGSHDSLTYTKPKHFLDDFYQESITKCQSLNIKEQYGKGIRFFDFRIRDDDGELTAAHGLVEYTTDVEGNLRFLNNRPGNIVRIILENIHRDGDSQYDWFRAKVAEFVTKYPNIRFVNGRAKIDWVKITNLSDEPKYAQFIWTVAEKGLLPHPRKYAEENNALKKDHINFCFWSLFDFIEIGLDL